MFSKSIPLERGRGRGDGGETIRLLQAKEKTVSSGLALT
jgi:hypothetical protein